MPNPGWGKSGSSEGKGGCSRPPSGSLLLVGPASSRAHEVPVWKGSEGLPGAGPGAPWGGDPLLPSACVLQRSPTPPCPRRLPRSLQTHSHPTPLSSSSSLLHPRNQSRITAVCLDPPGDTASSFQTVLVFTQPYWPRRCDPSSLSHHLLLAHSTPLQHPPTDLRG